MQVNRATFPATFPHFAALLETCDFYALDEEMTGITAPEAAESIMDSPAASYEAKRLAASRYSVMQCGVCLFHRVPTSSGDAPSRWHYVARPFNFLLFPHASGDAEAKEAKDIAVSPSTFAFLQSHGMDFQAWVSEGIGFCDRHGEAAWRAGQEAQAGSVSGGGADSSAGLALLLDGDRAWVEAAMASAETLAAAGAVAEAVVSPPVQSRAARDCLKALLAQRVPATVTVSYRRHPSAPSSVGAPPAYTAVLTAVSAAELSRRAAQASLVRQREALDALGFRRVFSALVASGKPCVGHNCFADWLFLLSCVDGPLPATLLLWKARLHSLFPSLFDTKYLSSRVDLFAPGRFASTHLGGLFGEYGLSSPRVEVSLPLGFQSYDPLTLAARGGRRGAAAAASLAHEAAYDALMTGAVFANMLHELGLTLDAALAGSSSVVNKVALFRSLFAVDVARPLANEAVAGSAYVLTHRDGVGTALVESCVEAASGWRPHARVYGVDAQTSVAAFTPLLPMSAEAVQRVLQPFVTTVRPLEVADTAVETAHAARFACPSPGVLSGTLPRLCWRSLFRFPR